MSNKTTTDLRIEPKVVEPKAKARPAPLVESTPPASPNILIWPEGSLRDRKVATDTMLDGVSIRHTFS